MTKHLLAKTAAAALLAATAMAANAQVTVYGSVDAGVARSKVAGAGSVTEVTSGVKSDNVLGFRGAEDLGGGLKATFNLEAGFDVDTGALNGANGEFFSRESSIGLQNKIGFAKIGKVKSIAATHAETFNAFDSSLLGAARDIFDDAGRYTSNTALVGGTIGPVAVTASYTFGEQEGSVSKGSTKAIGASYATGPLKVGVAHTAYDDAGESTQFGASYDLKVLSVYGNYETNSARAVDTAYALGFKAPLVRNVTAIAEIGKREYVAGVGAEKTFAAGLDYSLSKRTTVYSGFKQIDADGAGKSRVVAVGVNHKF